MMKFKFNIARFCDMKNLNNNLSGKTLQSILSLIAEKYSMNKEKGEWVQIPSTSFINITNNYKPYLEYLKEKNIILIDYHYVVGEKSRRYCFHNNFKEYAEVLEIKDNYKSKYTKLTRFIDEKIEKRIEKDFNKLVVNCLDVEKVSYTDKDGKIFYDFKNYLHNLSHLHLLKNKHIFFKWDCRLYNSFVELSSKIKLNNISFGDNQLVNLDIRSSFPLFLSIWLIENGMNKKDYEFKEFISGLRNGTFYSKLAHKLNNVKDTNNKTEYEKPVYTKNMAKLEFSKWLNGDNINRDGSIRNDDINYVFEKYFSSILEVFLNHKLDRRTFQNKLSYMEANFIFNIVCSKLYNSIPNINILTCHDSIYFDKKYYNDVVKIWNEELNKLYEKLNLYEDDDNIDYELLKLTGIETFVIDKKYKEKIYDELLN